jgi:hypothetical protein
VTDDTQVVGGIRLPKVAAGESYGLMDYVMNNADPETVVMIKRRRLMKKKNLEELDERANANQ